MKFKAIFDNGKPFEEVYNNEEDLKNALKQFYLKSQKEEYPYFDVIILNENEEDISECQFIQEMIRDIIKD